MNHTREESLPPAWMAAIPELLAHYTAIAATLANEEDVRPRRGLWFEALRRVAPEQVRVVLLGQDPYHGEDHGIQQAHGLSFSVPDGVRPPPSLRNMLKELHSDLGVTSVISGGNLTPWAEQGVLLLNAALTTRGGIAGAHGKHWQAFTHALMVYLGKREKPLVFILWGGHAQKFQELIGPQHIVISSVHPSPLSAHRGFFGSRPFSKTNIALATLGTPPVNW
ncbi:uracil-DNA glycosylase [Methylobacillus caricis]|uniref:uracil-DNA glycosylase n=1 Tax=Methylobacillus caricis TaxID=1971611 RepID=UPI001CFF8565|nr:uracil-DNA glycosylase [Methylobacillus caricis]MCB5188911.1 uracil-DNA glycosylase [Methylobacillus caricis]